MFLQYRITKTSFAKVVGSEERSSINVLELRTIISNHLTADTENRKFIFKGIEQLIIMKDMRRWSGGRMRSISSSPLERGYQSS